MWITAYQMAVLFDKDETTIRKHINNVFKDGELLKEYNTQKMRVDGVKQLVPFYNLDVIISVGYRVKSKNGVIFRQWANKILKDYMLKGYAVNQKRLEYLEKTIKLIDVANRSDDELENFEFAPADGFIIEIIKKYKCSVFLTCVLNYVKIILCKL